MREIDIREFTPFDLQRIFFGDASGLFVLEIMFRTLVMYLFALVVVRLIGKRGIGRLSPFEYIIVIALGSAAGTPLLQLEVPLIYGMTAIASIVALKKVFSELVQKSEFWHDTVASRPAKVIENGELMMEVLSEENITKEEVLMNLRQQGVWDVGEVELGFFEPSGSISALKYGEGRGRHTMSTLPKEYKEGDQE